MSEGSKVGVMKRCGVLHLHVGGKGANVGLGMGTTRVPDAFRALCCASSLCSLCTPWAHRTLRDVSLLRYSTLSGAWAWGAQVVKTDLVCALGGVN